MLDFPSATTLLQNPMQIRGSDHSNYGSGMNGAAGGVSLPAQALQNLQRLLQSQIAAANPLGLQQALQRQHLERQQQQMDQGRKQLQGMLASLQEQYQMNLLQQQNKGNPALLASLQRQQQQIMAQMQMTQQALILGGGNPDTPPKEERLERERHLSENLGSIGSDGSLKENRPDNNNEEKSVRSRHPSRSESLSPPLTTPPSSSFDTLYHRGHCHWPGCETPLPDIPSFSRHLHENHNLDDKALAQTRVQLQIVHQLELQLQKEKDKLRAMMLHLNLEQHNGELREIPPVELPSTPIVPKDASRSSSPELLLKNSRSANIHQFNNNNNNHNSLSGGASLSESSPLSALTAAVRSPLLMGPNPSSVGGGLIRPKPPPVEKNLSLPPGFDERRGRGDRGNPNLDPAMDIQQNREFYKHNDVRPPYTYAALIRYAVQETSDQQLTLHEIYNWFTTTFAYFRRNAASWKNAVRHNLSLHKCFMRVENVKGAVWTVDDEEYHRRRPPRGSAAPAAMSPSVSGSPTLTPPAPSLLDSSSLSSMLAAHGPSFFNQAFLQQAGQRAAAAAAFAAASSTPEEPPTHHHQSSSSIDHNRSTPGSLDFSSRIKNELEEEGLPSSDDKAEEEDMETKDRESLEEDPSSAMDEEENDDAQDLSLSSSARD